MLVTGHALLSSRLARGCDVATFHIPLKWHLRALVCLLGSCLLGNLALDLKMPLPLFFLIKCGNLITSMAVGFWVLDKSFPPKQLLAVILVTAGLFYSSMAVAQSKEAAASAGAGAVGDDMGSGALTSGGAVLLGAVLLLLALLCGSLLGACQVRRWPLRRWPLRRWPLRQGGSAHSLAGHPPLRLLCGVVTLLLVVVVVAGGDVSRVWGGPRRRGDPRVHRPLISALPFSQ